MTEGSAGGAGARRCPRWIWAVMVLSLAGNLAVAGVLGGRYLDRMTRDPELGRFAARLLEDIPEGQRAEAREILLAGRGDRETFRRRLAEASLGVTAALAAEPFDPAALERAVEARRAVFAGRWERRRESFLRLAGALDAEGRARLAEGFEERIRNRLERKAAR